MKNKKKKGVVKGQEAKGGLAAGLFCALATPDATLLANMRSGVAVCDHAGKVIAANAAANEILGLDRNSLLDRVLFDSSWHFLHEDGSPWAGRGDPGQSALRGRRESNVLAGAFRQDGSRIWLSLDCFRVDCAPHDSGAVACVFSDITSLYGGKGALEASEARFRSFTQLSSDFYWETNAAHSLKEAFWGAGAGIPSEQIEGHVATLDARLPFSAHEFSLPDGHGDFVHYEISGEPIYDGSGHFAGYRGVGRDITERTRTQQTLTRLAHYEALTGLPNRALLGDRLAQAIARTDRMGTLLGVMILDLDNFKEINDALGQAVGDQVLTEAARRLQSCLRSIDTLARLGDDEFAVLLEGAPDFEEISRVAQRLLSTVAERSQVAGHELYLSASIGLAVYPVDDHEGDALLRNAHLAMHHAKREGRNNLQRFSHDMAARSERHAELKIRLRRALEGREFTLHYQPQVALPAGRVIGVEALLRWNDRGRMVSPAEFIPIAEESGLIVDIGQWVLLEACRQAKDWLDKGHAAIQVAVNLSPRQFRQKSIVKSIEAILAETRLPARCLELEITETTIMHSTAHTIGALHELTELGVQISVDDFGTGYSSLAYLHRFPVHKLKIDQSFVRGMRSDHSDAALVGTMVALAKQLKLTSVAEGVETEEQLLYLLRSGCDACQGYLFSEPRPAEELNRLLGKKVLRAVKASLRPAPLRAQVR